MFGIQRLWQRGTGKFSEAYCITATSLTLVR